MKLQSRASRGTEACLSTLLWLVVLPAAGRADDYYYTGGDGNVWDGIHIVGLFPPQVAGNWHDFQAGTDVNFPPTGGIAHLHVSAGIGSTNATVNYNHSYSGNGLASLIIDSNNTLSQTSASTAMLATSEVVGGNISTGTYVQSAGSNVTSALTLGQFGSSGTYSLGGGSLTVNGAEVISYAGGLSSTFNQTGGTHTANQLILAQFANPAQFNLSGGTLTVNGDETVGYNTGSNATFTQSGANTQHTIAGTLYLARNSGAQGTFNLQGGTLTVGTVQLNSGGDFIEGGPGFSATTFNQNGGEIDNELLNQGTFNYSGGTFHGSLENHGVVNLNADFTAAFGINNFALLNIPAGRTVNAAGPGFTNSGTLTLAGGTLLFDSSSNFNSGTLNCDPTRPFHIGTGNEITNTGTINLNGTLIEGAGQLLNTSSNAISGTIAGYGTIACPLFNTGTLSAQGGLFSVTTAFTNIGQIQVSPGASFFSGGVTNTGAIHGAGMVGGTVVNNSGGTIEPVAGVLSLTGALSNNAGGNIDAATGNKLLVTLGLAANAGTINLSGGIFDNNNHPLNNTGSVVGYGTLRTGGLTNNGSILLSGGSASVAGDVTNAAGHTLAVKFTPAIFTGNVTNNGTVHVTKTTVTFAGTYTENGTYISDPSDNYFSDLTVSPSGALTAGAGDRFLVSGNFANSSAQSSTWNTSAAQLIFQGGTTHQMSVAGSVGSFGWGTMSIGSGQSLTLTGNSATAAATANDGTLSQAAGSSSLGALLGAGTVSVGNVVGSSSSAIMNVASFQQSSVSVNSTGTLTVAAHSPAASNTTGTLAIAAGGKLDLSNSSLQINYGGGASPIAAVRAELTSGYAGGAWNGPGIDTSAADASHELGYADSATGVVKDLPPGTVLVKYTVSGDADLDGKVDFNDLVILARHYNQSNANWDQGDFNYDGTVGFDDLVLLARNYGKSVSAVQMVEFSPAFAADIKAAFAQVPEPHSAVVVAAVLLTVPGRRRSAQSILLECGAP